MGRMVSKGSGGIFGANKVTSLSLAAWNLFLLPLDVANQKGLTANPGGIPMDKLTLGLYGSTIAMVILIVPFTIYYYEGEDSDDDPDGESKRYD